jgi:hypothetical protein
VTVFSALTAQLSESEAADVVAQLPKDLKEFSVWRHREGRTLSPGGGRAETSGPQPSCTGAGAERAHAARFAWACGGPLLPWCETASGSSWLQRTRALGAGGQRHGLLTILAGIMLVNFPARRRLERRILAKPGVVTGLNRFPGWFVSYQPVAVSPRLRRSLMTKMFAVNEEADHHVADPACAACSDEYPEPCPCGGLMHGVATDDTREGTAWATTKCDQCGRSEEDVEEELGREPAG